MKSVREKSESKIRRKLVNALKMEVRVGYLEVLLLFEYTSWVTKKIVFDKRF